MVHIILTANCSNTSWQILVKYNKNTYLSRLTIVSDALTQITSMLRIVMVIKLYLALIWNISSSIVLKNKLKNYEILHNCTKIVWKSEIERLCLHFRDRILLFLLQRKSRIQPSGQESSIDRTGAQHFQEC